MISSAFKQIKIFGSIVCFNIVDVVDNLFWFKIATKMFFSYKPVLKNVLAASFTVRMIRSVNKNIAFICLNFPTTPIPMLISFFKTTRVSFLNPMIYIFTSCAKFSKILTIIFKSFKVFKRSATILTHNLYNHCCLCPLR